MNKNSIEFYKNTPIYIGLFQTADPKEMENIMILVKWTLDNLRGKGYFDSRLVVYIFSIIFLLL